MNSKLFKYLLLVSVVIIWSIIGYQIIEWLNPKDNLPINNSGTKGTQLINEPEADTFSIVNSYPDPFLEDDSYKLDSAKITSVVLTNNDIRKRAIPGASNPVKETLVISYEGLVANPEKKTKTGFLTINGNEKLVHEQEKIDSFKIVKIYASHIILNIKGKTKIVYSSLKYHKQKK